MNNRLLFTLVLAAFLIRSVASAQSVEVYGGHQRTGVDLMWFKNFKNAEEEPSSFLFFSRNRASINEPDASTAFGSTNAVSYNFKNGLGIVAVGAFLNAGFTTKTGLQYFKSRGDFMFFGWLVTDLKKQGSIDLFGMFRYQPQIGSQWRLFSQVELFPVFSPQKGLWNLTERLRLGAWHHDWAAGAMADFNQTGRNDFIQTGNLGIFLRHDF